MIDFDKLPNFAGSPAEVSDWLNQQLQAAGVSAQTLPSGTSQSYQAAASVGQQGDPSYNYRPTRQAATDYLGDPSQPPAPPRYEAPRQFAASRYEDPTGIAPQPATGHQPQDHRGSFEPLFDDDSPERARDTGRGKGIAWATGILVVGSIVAVGGYKMVSAATGNHSPAIATNYDHSPATHNPAVITKPKSTKASPSTTKSPKSSPSASTSSSVAAKPLALFSPAATDCNTPVGVISIDSNGIITPVTWTNIAPAGTNGPKFSWSGDSNSLYPAGVTGSASIDACITQPKSAVKVTRTGTQQTITINASKVQTLYDPSKLVTGYVPPTAPGALQCELAKELNTKPSSPAITCPLPSLLPVGVIMPTPQELAGVSGYISGQAQILGQYVADAVGQEIDAQYGTAIQAAEKLALTNTYLAQAAMQHITPNIVFTGTFADPIAAYLKAHPLPTKTLINKGMASQKNVKVSDVFAVQAKDATGAMRFTPIATSPTSIPSQSTTPPSSTPSSSPSTVTK